MAYKVIRSEDCDRDLNLIFRHFVDSYVALGDPVTDAFDRAIRRIATVEDDMESLAIAPHQGSREPKMLPGLRHVTKNRAVFYFQLDEMSETLRVVAVFFGGQDHYKRMLKRLKR
ncbi:hypothetical protein SAMN03159496_00754 [Rhizobium sp. NFR07]|uniref:KluB n=1 Tax=Rhizobium sp. NFR07 TaxID=1566262 RepID=UPI0008EC3515|nr:KluB [Rhizobium sp. NFR07]SFA89080.1 hypothetical protein SAMN03159496_00754 [Rhizobium sp. NFR07]